MAALFLAALIALPAASALAAPAGAVRLLRRTLQATVAVWLIASLCWLLLSASGTDPADTRIDIATLLQVESAESEISLAADLSGIRVGLLMSGLLLLLPVVVEPVLKSQDGSVAVADRRTESVLRLTLGILSAGSVALLSDDVIVVVGAWLVLDLLLIRFADVQTTNSPGRESGSNMQGTTHPESTFLLTVLRVSSVALLAAVLLATTRYHTTSLTGFVEAASADERVEAGVVRGGILVWFALAVAGRAALFPLGIWLRPLTESASRATLPLVAWSAVLPAGAVWLPLTLLLPSAPDSGLLISVLAGMSGITYGVISAVTARRGHSSSSLYLMVIFGACTLMSVSIPSLAPAQSDALLPVTGVVILLANVAAVGVLYSPVRRRAASLIAGTFLLSGLGGPNYLLDLLQSSRLTLATTAEPLDMKINGSTTIAPGVVTGLWWVVCATQFLVGALITLHLSRNQSLASAAIHDAAQDRPEDAEQTDEISSESTSNRGVVPLTMLTLAVVACAGLAATASPAVTSELSNFADTGLPIWAAMRAVFGPLCSFNAATPCSLLGATFVWLFSLAPTGMQERLRTRSASLQRLARNWLYSGEAVAGLRMIVSGAAFAVEFFDRRLLGGQKEDGWRQNAGRVAGSIEEIGDSDADYASLAALLAVAGLLLALSGFGR